MTLRLLSFSLAALTACGGGSEPGDVDAATDIDAPIDGEAPPPLPEEIDETFGTDGFAYVDEGSPAFTFLDAAAVASDGTIVAVGFTRGRCERVRDRR